MTRRRTLAILPIVVASTAMTACPTGDGPKRAIDHAAYTAALQDCLDRGKDAGSIAVYRTCADDVDRKAGAK